MLSIVENKLIHSVPSVSYRYCQQAIILNHVASLHIMWLLMYHHVMNSLHKEQLFLYTKCALMILPHLGLLKGSLQY